MTEVNIPNSVTLLADGAFRDCSALKKVTLGENIAKIYQNTFASVQLEVIVINSPTVLNTDSYLFSDICSANKIYVPDELVEEYKSTHFYYSVADKIFAISEYEVA